MIRLNSKVVAEFLGKRHDNLMRAIRTDIKNLENPVRYYEESSYTDGKGQKRDCYEISIEGCERLARKLSEEEREVFLRKCRENAGEILEAREPVKEYTAKEVADMLGISERAVYRKLSSGELKSEKREYIQTFVRERTVITSEALEEYMNRQEVS